MHSQTKRENPFVILPLAVLTDPDLSVHAKLVYCALAKFANNTTGICWPQLDTIAEVAGVHRATVARELKNLRAKDLVKWTTTRSKRAKNNPNRYTVNLDPAYVAQDQSAGDALYTVEQRRSQHLYSQPDSDEVHDQSRSQRLYYPDQSRSQRLELDSLQRTISTREESTPVHSEPTPGVTVNPPHSLSQKETGIEGWMVELAKRANNPEYAASTPPPEPPQEPVSPPQPETGQQPGSEGQDATERARASELIQAITAHGRTYYKRYHLSDLTAYELWRMGNQVGHNAVLTSFRHFCERKGDKLNIAAVSDIDLLDELSDYFKLMKRTEREAQERAHLRAEQEAREREAENERVREERRREDEVINPALRANGVNPEAEGVWGIVAVLLYHKQMKPEDITVDAIMAEDARQPFSRLSENIRLAM